MKSECAIFDIKGDYDKYKFFWECALDIFFLIDSNGGILDANNAPFKEYGYSNKQLMSMNISDLRIPSERAAMKDQLQEAFERNSMFQTLHQPEDDHSRCNLLAHNTMGQALKKFLIFMFLEITVVGCQVSPYRLM